MLQNNIQNIENTMGMMFGLIPQLMLFCIALVFIVRTVGPFVEEMASARQKERAASREQERIADQRKSRTVKEMAIRAEFDDWLVAQVLRLQIDCADNRADQEKAKNLAVLEEARTKNTARIIALHHSDETTPLPELGTAEVQKQWDQLRATMA